MTKQEILELTKNTSLRIEVIEKATPEVREKIRRDIRIISHLSFPIPENLNLPRTEVSNLLEVLEIAFLNAELLATHEDGSHLSHPDRTIHSREGLMQSGHDLTPSHDEEYQSETGMLSPEHPISLLAQHIFDKFYNFYPDLRP
ncbi:hypothetical protein [Ignatzschineria cameli]|uniref:hypothetical protein n=1 Tax=Ignatzschineria cameli TaxID=2182793 RepID=UPI001057D0B5|nr:hypothetical protein [Ignatzschineria cameli]